MEVMSGLAASISIFGLIVLLVGAGFLQVFLSKRESKWPGLVLPIITFCYSLLAVLGMIAYVGDTVGTVIWRTIWTLVIFNIPTFILVTIYFAVRKDKRKNKEINKMNIKDL